MARTSTTWTTSEQARAARLGQGRLQKARAKGSPEISVAKYRRRLRQMVPEALEALAAALQNPRERVAAARVLLEKAFPPAVVAAIESAGPTRFTISFNRSDGDSNEDAQVERPTREPNTPNPSASPAGHTD